MPSPETILIHIEILDSMSKAENHCDSHLFFCNQKKQKIAFNPFEYAYIESTSNHYSQWHPINPDEPILSIYINSHSELLKQLHAVGLNNFWRVHSSYIINSRCVNSFVNGKIILQNQHKAIPIGREYKEYFLSKVTVF